MNNYNKIQATCKSHERYTVHSVLKETTTYVFGEIIVLPSTNLSIEGQPPVETGPFQHVHSGFSFIGLCWLTLAGEQTNQILAVKWGFPTKPQ